MNQAESSSKPETSTSDQSAEAEHRFHHYRGNAIPWFVRIMWLGFWIFAVAYTILYLFPALQREFFG